MRIAVGGFQHETNTFSPVLATLADFEAADAWPGLVTGVDLLDAVRGINLPAAGFIAQARTDGHEILPLSWCSATPSGRVTRAAYEQIVDLLLTELQRQLHRVDAVYLDLHGAMAAEHLDDADGETLRRVRTLIGPHRPLVASLDFHANVSAAMVANASVLCAYRTYPHTDMADAGVRTLRCLAQLQSQPLTYAFRPLDFLLPLTTQCTLTEPLASIMSAVDTLERLPLVSLNFTPGFPAADVDKCGPMVFGYGFDPARTRMLVDDIAAQISDREREFALELYSIDDALRIIASTPLVSGKPIVLADTQDNPGGGGYADTTSLLKALLARRIPDVLAGVLCDSQAAGRAHEAGVGAHIDVDLAGIAPVPGESPLHGRFEVLALGDGAFTATGPFYRGARMELGPMALLRIGGLSIVVASRKQQAADQTMFRHVGVEPSQHAVLVLKSSVHFRADFGPFAQRILVVEAPGPNVADPAKLPFTQLRPGLRLRPRS
ncbi:MAG: M81 family metallopeptidase [Steroidobacteraceae bacterium]